MRSPAALRRSHARIQGGRAWYGIGSLSPELARFATPHSAAEYNVAKLPPPFVRGLEGLLDDDERLLYAIERPARIDVGWRERFRSSRDRRAALLLLTDRQVLWLVDHAAPDRYLLDWGVDVTLVPIEHAAEVNAEPSDPYVLVRIATTEKAIVAGIPRELAAEADLFARLLRRFGSEAAAGLPRRQYEMSPLTFDPEPAGRFGQADAACRLLDELRADLGDPIAFLYSPAREGQRQSGAVFVDDCGVSVVRRGDRARVDLEELGAVRLVLSPLAGRIAMGGATRTSIAYPATLGPKATDLIRVLRRAWANRPGA